MIQIVDKHDCCGCTACTSICGHNALAMVNDEEGFIYPKSTLSLCVDCGLCERVCPIRERDSNNQIHNHSEEMYAAYNKNVQTHTMSSSGGVFAALAEYCVKKNGVVFGAEYDENLFVIHKSETTIEGILKFKGSKYVQSDLRGIFCEIRDYLKKGKLVLFSGVPCQVEGLKCFLMRHYPNLITIDILCHGVPSPKVYADYISYIRKHSILPLKTINMKDKTFGWGYQNLRLYFWKGISEFNSPVSNLWNKLFYSHLINRPSCYKCRFKNLDRTGDISIGDFWGIEKSHPEIYSKDGVSLILINTEVGNRIWKEIKEHFVYLKSDTSKCMQPVLHTSYPEPAERLRFWEEYLKIGFKGSINKRYYISRMNLIKRDLKLLKGQLIYFCRKYLFHS